MQNKKKNIVIYGAGITGKKIFNHLKKLKKYKILAFIDDSLRLEGTELFKIPIKNFDNSINFLKKNKIEEIYLAIPSLKDDEKRIIIQKIYKINKSILIKSTGKINEILIENQNFNLFKNINYDNFFSNKNFFNTHSLRNKNIYKKTVLITGAGGSIGSELSKQVLNLQPNKLILLDSSESSLFQIQQELFKNSTKKSKIIASLISICEKNQLDNLFKTHNIDTIYHAAAYKHVGLVENNIYSSIKNNILGTFNLCDLTNKYKVKKFVLISSDKAVEPNNVMGLTKKISELICQEFSERRKSKFATVRFGNVIGSSGSVIPIFQKQIQSGGPITLTHKKVERYFMSISEAVSLVIEAGKMDNKGKIYVLDMGRPIKILNLAKKMCNFFGYKLVEQKKTNFKNEILLKIIGLGNGEKIKEKLLEKNESFEKSSHPLIFRVSNKFNRKVKIIDVCNKILEECEKNNISNLQKILKKSPFYYKNKIRSI